MTADEHEVNVGPTEAERAERAQKDETISDVKSCPVCSAPIENLRATCPSCGYEYKQGDYDDPEAGKDFVTGSEIDDHGNEVIDESGAVASQRKEKQQ